MSATASDSIMETGTFVNCFLLVISLVIIPVNGGYDKERDALLKGTFPQDFIWSSATAAYQIEGAWNVSDKGPSVWDTLAHQDNNRDTGDVACDSYHKYPADIQLMKQIGLKYYRFSISWPRVFPTGEQQDGVNQDGVDYYNRLIDELKANDIEPMVTLFHWDLPQDLQDKYGGFLNNHTTNTTVIHDLFGDYARFCYRIFGDRVKYWITFNDPWIIALEGYGIGNFPPKYRDPAEGQYIAAHNIILSHAKAYHIYDDEFRAAQGGQVSIALSCDWGEPKYPDDPDTVEAAERYVQFFVGWFAHAIYKNGDYPDVMKATMARKGREEGRNSSRLPEFTPEQKAYINRTSDFFALNYYTTVEVADKVIVTDNPNYFTDMDVEKGHAADWPQTPFTWLYTVPWGIRKLLGFIRDEYGDPDVYITENGRPDHDQDPAILMDMDRICSYMMHTNEVMKARNLDNVKVKAYTAWSLMDGYEWMPGYSVRFGLYYVDFNDPDRTRYPKASSVFYKQLVRNNGYPEGSEFTKYVENMWCFCHNTTEAEVNGYTGGGSQISSLFSLFLAILGVVRCFID